MSPPISWMAAFCSGPAINVSSPPSSSGLRPARISSTARRRAARKALGSGSTPGQGPLDQGQEVAPHPRHPGELGPVGHLVQGQPQAELPGREAVAALDRRHVGAHVVDDVLVFGMLVLDEQLVVLAEHPGRHPARAPGRSRPR